MDDWGDIDERQPHGPAGLRGGRRDESTGCAASSASR